MARVKRIYDPPEPSDGDRVLVERLWPRGVSRERAHLDAWERRVAPSADLRRWYGHDPSRWDEFQRRYEGELSGGEARDGLVALRERARSGPLTLLCASKAVEISSAAVLARLLGA